MNYPDYCWRDYAFGGVARRNKVCSSPPALPAPPVDCYKTIFRFPIDFQEHFKHTGSVAGYDGDCFSEILPIDIDDSDLAKAQARAIDLVNYLHHVFEVDSCSLRISFSGKKGFHILLPEQLFGGFTASTNLNLIFREIAKELAGDEIPIDLKIYDKTRLFRILNTKHGDSGLFKIPLSWKELQGLAPEQIRTCAQSSCESSEDILPEDEIMTSEGLRDLYTKWRHEIENNGKIRTLPATGVTELQVPPQRKLCIYRLMQGVGEGERDEALLRIAAHFRKEGLGENALLGILLDCNAKNRPPLDNKTLEEKIKNISRHEYDYGCNDSVLSKYCASQCYLAQRKEDEERLSLSNVLTLPRLEKYYQERVGWVRQGNCLTLDFLPGVQRHIRGVYPGELMGVMGAPAIGKTSFGMHLCFEYLKKSSDIALLAEMELDPAEVYERTIQNLCEVGGADVEKIYLKEESERIAQFKSRLKPIEDRFLNLSLPALSAPELALYCPKIEQEYRKRIGVIVIDFIGLMSGKGGSEYEIQTNVVRDLKNLVARPLRKPVVFLCQISREYRRSGGKDLDQTAARGSGWIEELSAIALGFTRDSEGNYRCDILKNRRGELASISIGYNKRSLRFYEIAQKEEPGYEIERGIGGSEAQGMFV
jgi:hypothetical protein